MNSLLLAAALLAAPAAPKHHDTAVWLHGAVGHDLAPNITAGLTIEPDPSTQFYFDVTYQAKQTFRQETTEFLSYRYALTTGQMPNVTIPEVYARERVVVKLGARWRVH